MLVFFSGRRLKPERWEQFREAWGPSGDEMKKDAARGGGRHLPRAQPQGPRRGDLVRHLRGRSPPTDDKVRGDEEEELKRQEAMGEIRPRHPPRGGLRGDRGAQGLITGP